jgi:hypothetical protein
MKQLLQIVFIILAIGIVLFFFDFNFISGEITEHSLSCKKDKYINHRCAEKWLPLNSVTYKPDKKNQKVFYWHETSPEIQTLTKCAVVDRKNWTCKFNDESAEFGFKNGDYWNVSLTRNNISDDLFKYKYVPKWQFRLYQMKWWGE